MNGKVENKNPGSKTPSGSAGSGALYWLRTHGSGLAAYGGLLLCILVFSIVPPMFGQSIWTGAKLSTLMSDVIVTALMAVGAVFVYSLGNMDISIGGQVGLYATLMVLLGNRTGSLSAGILLSLLIAVCIGVINGATGEILKIHPIIPSLVFMMVLNGIRSILYTKLGSRNVSLSGIDYSLFKQPWFMAVVLALEVVLVTFLFRYTRLGKNAKAIGANSVVAAQSGINLIQYKALAYVVMGLCVVLASVFQMGYTGSASDATGTGFEMNVMVALILGGMPLSGGMGAKVSCALIGAFTYSLLDVGLPLIGVPNNMTFLVKAVIFILVVLITCRKRGGTLPR